MNRHGTDQIRQRAGAARHPGRACAGPAHRRRADLLRHNVRMRSAHCGPGSYARADAARDYIASATGVNSLWDALPGGQTAVQPPAGTRHVGTAPDGAPVFLAGTGPDTGSSCTALAVRAPQEVLPLPYIHDVNGFYAALGVDPRASVKELSRAYFDLGGHADPWITEALMILRDPDKRAAYDAMVPPQRYLDEATAAQRRREAAVQRARDFEASNGGTRFVERVYADDTRTPQWSQAYTLPEDAWGYSYYLWDLDPSPYALQGLPQWQEMIVSALADGPPLTFAVGRSLASRRPVEEDVQKIGATLVAFLPYGIAPTPAQAYRAARQLRYLASPHRTLIRTFS